MSAVQVVQALSVHPAWLALLFLLFLIIHLVWLRVRTRVNIARARAWDRASQDIGVSEDERRKLFVNAMRRDLQLRDSDSASNDCGARMLASGALSGDEKNIPLSGNQ